ncbi:hypothetical protein Dsin_030528 [Dipteronia sinensis]|uniref:Reverse transcriptase domain-containing protein n=1 Tax=Dipteronia sinensis TaxID=43782 RepID=A0AAE0DRE6_9ROSI|nr:hypothetical protein Dsin_030528 [Dipteronia sinensis]
MTKRGISEDIWERLDRALCSMDWRIMFAEGYVRHLPRVASDHCPILLCPHSTHIPHNNLKPFRFKAMWLKHDKFGDLVKHVWELDRSSLLNNIQLLSNNLKGIQKSLGERFSNGLVRLEATLSEEYNKIIEYEVVFWLQKSRNIWLKEGDRNTKFFHLTTMVRRRHNKLEGLKSEDDIWKSDKSSTKDIVISYFQKLFSTQTTLENYNSLPHMFPCLEEDVQLNLTREVSEDEVRFGLFGIGGLKAPGPDGFPAIFFQKQWEVCKKELIKLVVDSFNTGTFPIDINYTLISLVPKVPSPFDMTQIRPISLCNTTYKIISKIIVQRLRDIMLLLVSPNQVAFVPGRQIQDNIVIVKRCFISLEL